MCTNVGDFIRFATDRKSPAVRSNRFRALTVDDLNALSTPKTASRGGGHFPLTREADPKLAESDDSSFPPLTPSGEEEKSLEPRSVAKQPSPSIEGENQSANKRVQEEKKKGRKPVCH